MSEFKTTPMAHQLAEYEASRDARARALFWEMGVGKTWVALNTAAHLYRRGEIDALLVLAPNSVHVNWVTDEIPKHMPDDVRAWPWAYSTRHHKVKWHEAACEGLIGRSFPVLTMSYDGFRTGDGRRLAERMLAKRRCLYILDESQRIKTPGIKRTISVVATGRRASYKRILTGTPITNKPFDVYSQMKFLDETFWASHGLGSYEAFKTFFGVWEERVATSASGKTGRFSQVVAFKNLDRLGEIIQGVASRVTKKEAVDLPPKSYTKRYFDLSPEQVRLYHQLRDDLIATLSSGETVSAPLMVTRLLRFQQVTCGYLPGDQSADGELHRLADNPRLRALEDTLEDVEGSAIIWARFREDVDQICALLGDQAVRYDGAVGEDDRLAARRAFQAGERRFFVGNPAVAGTGLTLTAGTTVIYYSNSFDLEHRQQSEDRAHRIGQTHPVTYVDLIAQGTIDEKIVSSLREKRSIASTILGDEIESWI